MGEVRKKIRTILLAVLVAAGLGLPADMQAAAQPSPPDALDCDPLPSPDGNEPPCNPYLAPTVWSANHRNAYAQASSPVPGPLGPPAEMNVHHEGVFGAPIVLTFSPPYPDGGHVVWGSTVGFTGEVFKLDPDSFTVIDEFRPQTEGGESTQNPGVTGAYNVLDRDNRLIVARTQALEVYADADPDERFSPVERLHRLDIPDEVMCRADSDENLIGINLTYDGHVAFATSFGVVGVVPRDPGAMTADNIVTLSLNGERCDDASVSDEDLEEVANTIATDEDGGIYVITDTTMRRVDWDGSTLASAWSVDYEVERDRSGSLGPGSGASPTLMGTRSGDDDLVVIYDDAEVFNLVLLWRDEIPTDWEGIPGEDRRVACKLPVDFGRDDDEVFSEQSPLVRGNSVVLVNDRLQGDPVFEQVPSRLAGFNQLTGGVPGNEPRGVERIDWDPRTRTCETVWERPDLSVPNTIPTMSAGSDAFYAVGVREGTWTLEALDWATGDSLYHVDTAPYPTANSFWAATTVGPDESIYSGTFGGVTRWQQCDPGADEECGRRPDPVEYLVGDPAGDPAGDDSDGDPDEPAASPSPHDGRGDDGSDAAAAPGARLPSTGGTAAGLGVLALLTLALARRRRD